MFKQGLIACVWAADEGTHGGLRLDNHGIGVGMTDLDLVVGCLVWMAIGMAIDWWIGD